MAINNPGGSTGTSGNPTITQGLPIRNATALTASAPGQTAGSGILITASVLGTVTLTLAGSTSIIVTVAVGDNMYPFAVTNYVPGTATVTRAYNLSYT